MFFLIVFVKRTGVYYIGRKTVLTCKSCVLADETGGGGRFEFVNICIFSLRTDTQITFSLHFTPNVQWVPRCSENKLELWKSELLHFMKSRGRVYHRGKYRFEHTYTLYSWTSLIRTPFNRIIQYFEVFCLVPFLSFLF